MSSHDPALQPDPHARHDRLLISARAAGDLLGHDLERATALLASCPACSALDADLRSIALATRRLAADARSAERDFRLSPARAAALSRGSLWRRLARPFGQSRGEVMRPLAGAFTTLGIAGLLLAALPFLPMTGGPATALAPAPSADRGAIHETMNPEAMLTAGPEMNAGAAATQAPTGADAKSTDIPGGIESLATIDIAAGSEDGESVVAQSAAPAVSLPLILLSVTFLALGIGLLLLRASGIRRR